MTADLLQLSDITKRFARVSPGLKRSWITAVDDVSLGLSRGEVIALLGANGAGKSTLLRIIAGTILPDAGEVHKTGQVGILLGNSFGLYDRLSAREYLTYIARLRGIPAGEVPHRIQEVAGEMGLTTFLERRCGGFSAGMRQRTALAATTIHRPDLLLLDEPTTGLDIHVRKSVLEAIADLAERGHSMIISTHNPEEVRDFATRVVVIDKGRTIATIERGDTAFAKPFGLTEAATALIPEGAL